MFGDQALTIIIKAVDQASDVFKRVDSAVQSSTSSFSNAVAASQKFALALGGAATVAGGFISQGIKVAAQLETQRHGFITLLGSTEKADAAINRIKNDAATTPFEITGLVQANQLLTSVTKDADRSERFLLNIGKALAAMGKGQPEMDRIIVNLQQIGAVGKASMLDIKQFAFAGIPIFDMLKEKFAETGRSAADLDQAIQDGNITFEMLEEMFNRAGEGAGQFSRAFIDQAGTFSQLWSNMKDSINIFLADFVKSTGIFDLVKSAVAKFVDLMNKYRQPIIDFFKALFSEENRTGLLLIAGMIGGGLVGAFWALALAIGAVTSLLLPWIALGGVVAGTAYAIYESFKILSQDGALLWNWFTGIIKEKSSMMLESISLLWDGIKTAFKEGINFVISLAENWANSFIDAVNAIIGALNKIKFSLPSWVPGIGGKSFGINIPLVPTVNLPRFEHGGIVPGAIGEAVLIIAHGQERVIPAGMAQSDTGSVNISVIINNPSVRNQSDLNDMRSQINDALRDLIRVHKIQTI